MMPPEPHSSIPSPRSTAAAALALLLLTLGSACKQESSAPAPTTTAEIRGEPIRKTVPTPTPTPTASDTNSSNPAQVESAATATPSSPPPLPAPPTTALQPKPPTGSGTSEDPLIVGFETLAGFKYDIPEDPLPTNTVAAVTGQTQIPTSIQALDKKVVGLKGFMLPLKVESGLVTELLIMRDQSMCCFGTVPKINEWVSVKMIKPGVKPVMDQAITLFGRLHVGEVRENGYLVGIYQMDGERMASPLDM